MVVNCNRYLYAWNGWIVKNRRFKGNDNKLHLNELTTLHGTCWCDGSCRCCGSLYSKNINLRSSYLVFSNVRSSCSSLSPYGWSWYVSTNLFGDFGLDCSLFKNLYQVILKKIIKTRPYGWVFLFYYIFINKIKNYEK